MAVLCAHVACGGSRAPTVTPPPATTKGASIEASKAPWAATIGDKTMCLVSKEAFTVTAASPKVEYKGKTYYFCCPGCDTKFKQSPETYLSGGT